MVIRPEKLEAVKEELKKDNILGMTVTMVSGCGKQKGVTRVYRGTEFMINLLPKVKVEIVVHDDVVTELIPKLVNAVKTGEIGDGKIFVYNVEQSVKIRTGETGNEAI